MKIVGIGMNKTGTTTLAICLTYLGYRHLSCHRESFEQLRRGDVNAVLRTMEGYDSFEDWPWPLMYRDIDRRFPDARFILTRRKDPETWFRSLYRYAKHTGPTEYRRYIYGHYTPDGYRDEHIRIYLEHNQAVREYFHNRPHKLLELCWEQGDGWQELCAFLGVTPPMRRLPHANRSLSQAGRVIERLKSPLRAGKRLARRCIGARHSSHTLP